MDVNEGWSLGIWGSIPLSHLFILNKFNNMSEVKQSEWKFGNIITKIPFYERDLYDRVITLSAQDMDLIIDELSEDDYKGLIYELLDEEYFEVFNYESNFNQISVRNFDLINKFYFTLINNSSDYYKLDITTKIYAYVLSEEFYEEVMKTKEFFKLIDNEDFNLRLIDFKILKEELIGLNEFVMKYHGK